MMFTLTNPALNPVGQWYSAKCVMKMLGCTYDVALRHVSKAGAKKIGGMVRVREDKLADYLARLRGELGPTMRYYELDTHHQVVYFVTTGRGEPIKIGYTGSFYKRFMTLRGASPTPLVVLGLMPGDRATEQDLHHRFNSFRLTERGEWFHPGRALLDFIVANATPPPREP